MRRVRCSGGSRNFQRGAAEDEAPKALRGVWCGEGVSPVGVSPSPPGEASGEGAGPPPPKKLNLVR